MIRGPLFQFLADDHARLDELLRRATADAEKIDYGAYAEFRRGLLKHIAMEEKILLPAARRLRGGEALPIAEKLRRDHGAFAALLVPTPTPAIIAKLRSILQVHNALEEGPGGVYEVCEKLAADEAQSLAAEMRRMPDVRVLPHVDTPFVMEATRRALERAGYSLDNE